MFKKILIGLLLISTIVYAQKITVLAAADMRFALNEVKNLFIKEHPKDSVEIVYGSSGKGLQQIENGAPYDLYFSANISYVQKLYDEGLVITKPKLYALGRIVIWSTSKNFDPKKGFANLTQPWVKKIAIANPTHAPYGEKAKQALENIGIYKDIKDKLVLGENIMQTTQFVDKGAADIGVISLSVALAPHVALGKYPNYYLIDNSLHKPLLQGFAITKRAKDNVLAHDFYNYISSPEAKKILERYGFVVPKAK